MIIITAFVNSEEKNNKCDEKNVYSFSMKKNRSLELLRKTFELCK